MLLVRTHNWTELIPELDINPGEEIKHKCWSYCNHNNSIDHFTKTFYVLWGELSQSVLPSQKSSLAVQWHQTCLSHALNCAMSCTIILLLWWSSGDWITFRFCTLNFCIIFTTCDTDLLMVKRSPLVRTLRTALSSAEVYRQYRLSVYTTSRLCILENRRWKECSML